MRCSEWFAVNNSCLFSLRFPVWCVWCGVCDRRNDAATQEDISPWTVQRKQASIQCQQCSYSSNYAGTRYLNHMVMHTGERTIQMSTLWQTIHYKLVIWKHMREFTLEKNLTNAASATNFSISQGDLISTHEDTQQWQELSVHFLW